MTNKSVVLTTWEDHKTPLNAVNLNKSNTALIKHSTDIGVLSDAIVTVDDKVAVTNTEVVKIKENVNTVNSQLENVKQNKADVSEVNVVKSKTDYYVTPQMFGAKADGINDDSDAFNLALSSNDFIKVPEGTYLIKKPIKCSNKKTIIGCGENTILKVKNSTNVFEVGYRNSISNFKIDLTECVDYEGNVILINEETLKDWQSEGNASMRTRISKINVRSIHCGINSSVITMAMNTKGRIDGFYDVTFEYISHIGNKDKPMHYFFRSYCKEEAWITGINMLNCMNQGTVWGIFDGEKDINLNDPLITGTIGGFQIYNFQMQCDLTTKAFAYIRYGGKSFVNCIPWDWFYAEEEFNARPMLIDESCVEKNYFSGAFDLDLTSYNTVKNNTITPINYNQLTKIQKYIANYNVDFREKIIGVGEFPGSIKNKCKAFLLYKGKNITSSNQLLFFKYRNLDTIKWNEIQITRDKPIEENGKLVYTSTEEFPFYLNFYSKVIDNQIEIYIARNDDGWLTQYDIFKSEPLSNNIISYNGNSAFTNYFFTINNFENVFLEALPSDFTKIEKKIIT